MSEQWMEGMAGPTMQDLRAAGIEAHLAPIKQQLDDAMDVLRQESAGWTDEQRAFALAVCREYDVPPSLIGIDPS